MNDKRMNEAAINASLDACLRAAREGDVDLTPQRVREVYEEITASVGGFKEMSAC